jgi:hypothetical protein
MNPPITNSNSLLRLPDADRERLGEALRRLVANGAIIGTEPGQAELYHWAHLNQDWTEEVAALLDLKLFWDHELRLVQAVPQSGAFTLRMKLDATLVLLTLWYEFDMAVRDRGEAPPIRITVAQLNDSLKTKFEPLRKSLPSPTRLVEILRLAQRKSLLHFTAALQAAESGIEILPTLKRVIPFQDLADWTRHAERHLAAVLEKEDDEIEEEDAP